MENTVGQVGVGRRGRPPMVISSEGVEQQPVRTEGAVTKLEVQGSDSVKHGVHTILRTISNAPNGVDHFLAAEVDAYIGTWLTNGWTLQSVHLLSHEKDGTSFAFFLVQ